MYDMENQPYPMHQFVISCPSEGFCDEVCEIFQEKEFNLLEFDIVVRNVQDVLCHECHSRAPPPNICSPLAGVGF